MAAFPSITSTSSSIEFKCCEMVLFIAAKTQNKLAELIPFGEIQDIAHVRSIMSMLELNIPSSKDISRITKLVCSSDHFASVKPQDIEALMALRPEEQIPDMPIRKPISVPEGAFGPDLWRKFWGERCDLDEIPPLREDINVFLEHTRAPFHNPRISEYLSEKYQLILMPKAINGDPLTVNILSDWFIQKGLDSRNFILFDDKLGDLEITESYWFLIRKQPHYDLSCKRPDDMTEWLTQKQNVRKDPSLQQLLDTSGVRLPTALELMVYIALSACQKGIFDDPKKIFDFTSTSRRCFPSTAVPFQTDQFYMVSSSFGVWKYNSDSFTECLDCITLGR